MRIQSINRNQINQPSYIIGNNNIAVTFGAEEPQKDGSENVENIEDESYIKSSIGILTLSTVGMILMFSKGFQKNAGKYLNRFNDYMKGRLKNSAYDNSKKSSKFYKYIINRINFFIKSSDSINNITSLKDILFMKLMYKTKPTKKIHEGISNYFEKLSRKTVTNSYKKTELQFKQMKEIFDKLDEDILKNSPDEKFEYKGKEYAKKDLVALAKGYRDTAYSIINNFLAKEFMDYRYNYIKNVTSKLYSSFWDSSFKDFWTGNNKFKRKEMWQMFLAAEQIKGDKTSLAAGIATARSVLSYTSADKSEIIQNCIHNLDGIVPPSDKEGLKIISKLEWFIRHPEAYENNKNLFNKELAKFESHKIPVTDENLAKTQEECKKINIGILRDFLNNTSTGEIQDMLSIYYKIAPFELDKSGALISVKNAVKSFDKSVHLESVEFFDKVRDLRLGSAPTDILTIIASFIALSIGFGYAKTEDERKSLMLKSGIPIVGAIATAMYSTTKLVSGGKSLALGLLSGIVLNSIGKIADNILKTNNKQKATLNIE